MDELRGIGKLFDGNLVLKNINLAVETGEIVTLIDPARGKPPRCVV